MRTKHERKETTMSQKEKTEAIAKLVKAWRRGIISEAEMNAKVREIEEK